MKKIVLGLVLSLFLNGCGTSDWNEAQTYNYYVMAFASTDPVKTAFRSKKVWTSGGDTPLRAVTKAQAICEEWLASQKQKLYCVIGTTYITAKGAANKKKQNTIEAKKRKIALTEKQKESLILGIRKTCLDFGYKKGTEKYADCLKDLYIKETSQPVTINNSGSRELAKELKRQRRMEASEDLDRISKDLLGGKSIGESVGGISRRSSSKDVCFFDSERKSGLNKICYYKCVSGMKTKNVGASQMCPTNY